MNITAETTQPMNKANFINDMSEWIEKVCIEHKVHISQLIVT